jgi:two-component system sensor histidine kinase UhpB
LTNVARHAQATDVSVDLQKRGKRVSLTIRDNGRGMDLSESRKTRGLGLAGMQTRARACGGKLAMETSAGKGLKIEVLCPIGQ